MKKTPWEVLSKIDVNEHTEKKGNLTYLSWAWAWSTLKNQYPDATFEYAWFDYHDPSHTLPYCIDKSGYAYVGVKVTVENLKLTELLPVLDHKNKPIQKPNSFEVNKALKRCLAKCIAAHGLGAYIYAGEDLPEPAPKKYGKSSKDPEWSGPLNKGELALALKNLRISIEDSQTLEELTELQNEYFSITEQAYKDLPEFMSEDHADSDLLKNGYQPFDLFIQNQINRVNGVQNAA